MAMLFQANNDKRGISLEDEKLKFAPLETGPEKVLGDLFMTS